MNKRSIIEQIRAHGAAARRLTNEGFLPFSGEAVQSFFATLEAQGFPAVHHSEIYARLYRRAYRAAARQFLEEG